MSPAERWIRSPGTRVSNGTSAFSGWSRMVPSGSARTTWRITVAVVRTIVRSASAARVERYSETNRMSTLTTTITPTTIPARRSPVVRETAPSSISTTTNGFRRFRSSIRYHAGGFSVATSFRPNLARRGSTSDAGSPLSCASRRRSNAGTVASDASRRSGEAAPGIQRAGSRRLRDLDDFWTRVRSPVGIVSVGNHGRTPSPRATEARRHADERPRATPGRACRCCAAPASDDRLAAGSARSPRSRGECARTRCHAHPPNAGRRGRAGALMACQCPSRRPSGRRG